LKGKHEAGAVHGGVLYLANHEIDASNDQQTIRSIRTKKLHANAQVAISTS
jgi:hypothetical protein